MFAHRVRRKKLIATLHLGREPGAFAFGLRPLEGGWIDTGEWAGRAVQWWHNPRRLLPPVWRRVVELWRRSRGGGMGGVGWLPEPGGLNAQPAWLLAAFSVLDVESARLEALREGSK